MRRQSGVGPVGLADLLTVSAAVVSATLLLAVLPAPPDLRPRLQQSPTCGLVTGGQVRREKCFWVSELCSATP